MDGSSSSSESDENKFCHLPPEFASSALDERAFSSTMVSEFLSDDEEDRPRITIKDEILWAAEYGHLGLLKMLVGSDKSLVNVSDNDGYSVLHRATYNKQAEVVKWLLNQGASLNARTADNWTPLHSACYWNNPECVSLFLSLGADINAQSSGKVTPLHLAAANPNGRNVLQILLFYPNIDIGIKNEANETALEIAQRCGRNIDLFEMTDSCFRNFGCRR